MRDFFDFLFGRSVSKRLRDDYIKDGFIKSFLRSMPYPMDSYYTRLAIVNLGKKKALDAQDVEFIVESEQVLDNLAPDHKTITNLDVNINLEVENLIDNTSRNKILIIGAPGTGKTTLLRFICYQWSQQKLWHKKFNYILMVELKDLAPWLEDEGYYGGKKGLQPGEDERKRYANFIFFSNKDIPRERNFTTQVSHNELLRRIHSNKLLLLLDGYDEIMSAKPTKGLEGVEKRKAIDATQRLKNEAKLLVQAFDHVITTSRPKAPESGGLMTIDRGFTQILENIGFDKEGRFRYIQQYFAMTLSKQKQLHEPYKDLVRFIEFNPEVQAICRTPLNAELLCYLWQDIDARNQLGKQFSKTLLYKLIEQKLDYWYRERHNKSKDEVDPSYKTFTMTVAFLALKKGKPRVVDRQTLKEQLRHYAEDEETQSQFLQNVANQGFLSPVYRGENRVQDHYFAHKTFSEYFAARHLKTLLEDPNRQKLAVDFISEVIKEKNEDYYLEVFKFLAGLLDEEASINAFWCVILQRDGRSVLINDNSSTLLLMNLLSQALVSKRKTESTSIKTDTSLATPEKAEPSLAILDICQAYTDKMITQDPLHWLDAVQATYYPMYGIVDELIDKLKQRQIETFLAIPTVAALTTLSTTDSTLRDKTITTFITVLTQAEPPVVVEAIYGLKKLAYDHQGQLNNHIEAALIDQMKSPNESIALAASGVSMSLYTEGETFTTLLDNLRHSNPWIVLGSLEIIDTLYDLNANQKNQTQNSLYQALGNTSDEAITIVKVSYQQLQKRRYTLERLINRSIKELNQGDLTAIDRLGNLVRLSATAEERTKIETPLLRLFASTLNQHANHPNHPTWYKILTALEKLATPKAIHQLTQLAYHSNATLVELAESTLWQHRNQVTDTQLQEKLNTRFGTTPKIDFSQQTSSDGSPQKSPVEKCIEELATKTWKTMRRIGHKDHPLTLTIKNNPDLISQEHTDALVDLLQQPNANHACIAEVLAAIAKKRPRLINIKDLYTRLTCDSSSTREALLKTLRSIVEKRPELMSQEATAALIECLQDKDAAVQTAAAQLISSIAEKRAGLLSQDIVLILTEQLKGNPASVRQEIAKSIEIIANNRPDLKKQKMLSTLTKQLTGITTAFNYGASKTPKTSIEENQEPIDIPAMATKMGYTHDNALGQKNPEDIEQEAAFFIISQLKGSKLLPEMIDATRALRRIADNRPDIANLIVDQKTLPTLLNIFSLIVPDFTSALTDGGVFSVEFWSWPMDKYFILS